MIRMCGNPGTNWARQASKKARQGVRYPGLEKMMVADTETGALPSQGPSQTHIDCSHEPSCCCVFGMVLWMPLRAPLAPWADRSICCVGRHVLTRVPSSAHRKSKVAASVACRHTSSSASQRRAPWRAGRGAGEAVPPDGETMGQILMRGNVVHGLGCDFLYSRAAVDGTCADG